MSSRPRVPPRQAPAKATALASAVTLDALRADEASALEAIRALRSELVRGGAPTPVAKVVVRQLVPIVNGGSCRIHGELFGILGLLACAGDPLGLLFSKRDRPVDAVFLRTAEGVRAEAIARSAERRQASRIGAAFLFATLRRDRLELLPILRATLKREEHSVVRAAILLSLATLGRGKVARDEPLFTAALASPVSLEQLAGIVGLARLRALLPAERELLTSLLASGDTHAGFPWAEGDVGALARHAAARIPALRAARSPGDGKPALAAKTGR